MMLEEACEVNRMPRGKDSGGRIEVKALEANMG